METSMILEIVRAGFTGLTLVLLWYTMAIQNKTVNISQERRQREDQVTDRLMGIIAQETKAKVEMTQSIEELRHTVEAWLSKQGGT